MNNVIVIENRNVEVAFDRLMLLKDGLSDQAVAKLIIPMVLNYLGERYRNDINEFVLKKFFTLNFTIDKDERIYTFQFKTKLEEEIEKIIDSCSEGYISTTEAHRDIKKLIKSLYLHHQQ